MSHARRLFAELTNNVRALGRILASKEKVPDNVVQLPAPKRTLDEVKAAFSQACAELGARVAAQRSEQRIIDGLHAKMEELRQEGAAIEAAAAKVPEQAAP